MNVRNNENRGRPLPNNLCKSAFKNIYGNECDVSILMGAMIVVVDMILSFLRDGISSMLLPS
jgi:hypothetical protein